MHKTSMGEEEMKYLLRPFPRGRGWDGNRFGGGGNICSECDQMKDNQWHVQGRSQGGGPRVHVHPLFKTKNISFVE